MGSLFGIMGDVELISEIMIKSAKYIKFMKPISMFIWVYENKIINIVACGIYNQKNIC